MGWNANCSQHSDLKLLWDLFFSLAHFLYQTWSPIQCCCVYLEIISYLGVMST